MDIKLQKELRTLELELVRYVDAPWLSASDKNHIEKAFQSIKIATLRLEQGKFGDEGSERYGKLAEKIHENTANIRKLSEDPKAAAQVLNLAGDVEKTLGFIVALVEPDEPWPR
jgi:hypothetical protein